MSRCSSAIDNWRWADVPFYLRTGKSLTRRTTEIAIQFKRVPFALFRDTPVDALTPNVLALQIQPDEGISLQFGAKQPGPEIRLGGVRMDFKYRDYFHTEPSTGYETLVYDCMIGDAMLFQRADSVEAGWAAVQPILDVWQQRPEGRAARILSGRHRRPGGRRQAAVAQRPQVAADRVRRLICPSPPSPACSRGDGEALVDSRSSSRRRSCRPISGGSPRRCAPSRRPAPTGSMSMSWTGASCRT